MEHFLKSTMMPEVEGKRMKCFNCGKNFDYEKCYGICPKCGSFNKEETAQEQHQRYHNEYDNGYQHSGHIYTGSTYMEAKEIKEKNGRGSTIFLIISIVIFITSTFGFTTFGFLYSRGQRKRLLNEVAKSHTAQQVHVIGEAFAIQGMTLTVEEAWVVDEGQETNPHLPEGKKLVAVTLQGQSDGEWADKNYLSTAYIKCDGLYFEQMPSYEVEGNGDKGTAYDIPLFESVSLCMEKEAEGCLLFWVDEKQMDFTLCLEERVDEDFVFIETIHTIEIHLEEAYEGGQEHG